MVTTSLTLSEAFLQDVYDIQYPPAICFKLGTSLFGL